jgi:hypothetical protein
MGISRRLVGEATGIGKTAVAQEAPVARNVGSRATL